MKKFIVFLGILLAACGAAAETAVQQQIAVATYSTEQDNCVSLASTRAQADVCRSQVKEHWCGDGGYLREQDACAYSPIVDAGGGQ